MASRKKIEILDFIFDENEVLNKGNLNFYIYFEYLLHACYKLGIPEISISFNHNYYYSLYISKQKNKKYIDKIKCIDNSLLLYYRRSNSVLHLKYSVYNFRNLDSDHYFKFNTYYKTKLLSQEKIDRYLELADEQNFIDDPASNMYIKSNDVTTNSFRYIHAYCDYEKQLPDSLEYKLVDHRDDDNIKIVRNIFKYRTYSLKNDMIYGIILNLFKYYNEDYITSSEYFKLNNMELDINNNCIISNVNVPKKTLIRFANILLSDPSLAYLMYKKIKEKNYGTEVL